MLGPGRSPVAEENRRPRAPDRCDFGASPAKSLSSSWGGSIIGRSRRIRQLERKQEPSSVSNIVAAAYKAVCPCPPSAMLEGQTDPSTHNTPWMLRRYVCLHHQHNPRSWLECVYAICAKLTIWQAVSGYISRMVSLGDSTSGGSAAKMKILL
jgi:hypothetical protein